MAWRRPGDKPLSEPMMVGLPTHICVTRPRWINAFATGRCSNFKVYFLKTLPESNLVSNVTDQFLRTCEIIMWTPLNLDSMSTLVQVMTWCRQAAGQYLDQCWPRFMSLYGVLRPNNIFVIGITDLLPPRSYITYIYVAPWLPLIRPSGHWHRISNTLWKTSARGHVRPIVKTILSYPILSYCAIRRPREDFSRHESEWHSTYTRMPMQQDGYLEWDECAMRVVPVRQNPLEKKKDKNVAILAWKWGYSGRNRSISWPLMPWWRKKAGNR